ncbi:B-box zinc finger protein [Paraclostridium dentum]|uniref:B-box zinc finger protein n=1 Tax=Paraclostridium dentum TaxID=2662455 RepID=UPI003F3B4348
MDPVTFSTSHLCRNHNKPLTRFCKQDHTPVCENCIKRDHKHHKTVSMVKESNRIKVSTSFFCGTVFLLLSFLHKFENVFVS